MVGFLASVKDIDEATIASKVDIDILDLKNINDGALGTAGGNNITNLKSNFGNQDLASAQLAYRSSDGNWSSIRLYIWDKL